MAIDFAELARMVRKDRGEIVSQTAYGRTVGLSQGQVSDLELAKVRRLSHEVRVALEARLGALPELGHAHPSARKTARPLQPPGTDAPKPAATGRKVAKAELDRAWLQVGVAYETRKENPDRWTLVRKLLDVHVEHPEQERTDFQTRRRRAKR